LRQWHERFPHLSGPARYLAVLLMRQEQPTEKKLEEIEALLKGAAKQALSEKGREACGSLLAQIEFQHAIKSNDFKKAVKYARDMLKEDPTSIELLEQLFALYGKWIENNPAQGIGLIPQILKDFDSWEKQVAKSSSEETMEQARGKLNEITVFAAMVNLQVSKTPSRKELEQSLEALSDLLQRDSANMQATYGQMTVCWRLVEQLHSSSVDEVCHYARKAEHAADRLLAESELPRHQQDGNRIKERLKALNC
jgi:hypothetical protein